MFTKNKILSVIKLTSVLERRMFTKNKILSVIK
mgnify:CR=1 FL=1